MGSVVPNGVLVLLSEWARFARVSSIATFLTCHLRLHNLVNLLVWRFQPFHEKIHLGCQHIDTVNFMYSFCLSWLPISLPTLVGSNLVDERSSSCNIEGEKCSSRYCVHVILRSLIQAIEEVLNDKTFFHAVVWACCNVFLKTFPGFRDCLVLELFKTGNPVPKGISLAHQKVLDQKSIGTRILPCRCRTTSLLSQAKRMGTDEDEHSEKGVQRQLALLL